jgi:hypothetical protein
MKKTVALALTLAGTCAIASPQMKPGLWETATKSDAFKNMPQMPPEQAEQMRKMGITVPEFRDGAMIAKSCITARQASTTPGTEQLDKSCEMKNVKQGANSYSADIVCTGPEMKGSGKVVATYASDRFDTTVDFKGSMHGQSQAYKMETKGRWLGADCGSVKPAGNY